MTLEQLEHMAQAGVRVEMTAQDVLKIAQSMAIETKPVVEYIPLKEACSRYNCSRNTMANRIAKGVYRAYKDGGSWNVESPASRADRLQRERAIV